MNRLVLVSFDRLHQLPTTDYRPTFIGQIKILLETMYVQIGRVQVRIPGLGR